MEDEAQVTLESLFRNAPRNALQEAKWAGQYDDRHHWSMREACILHRDRLMQAQCDFQCVRLLVYGHFVSAGSLLQRLDLCMIERIADFAFLQGRAVRFVAAWQHGPPEGHPNITFVARKRPLLDFEVHAGDWDCVGLDAKERRIVCHDGRLHRTGRRLEMTHRKFVLDRVHGPSVSDDAFYQNTVQPLVESVLNGTDATVIFYGQTGTGKTHSFNACWRRVGTNLVGHRVSVTFFEIHGKKCYDLLQQRKEVALRADECEQVHVRGATTCCITPTSTVDMETVLAEALLLRRSEATQRNPVSSRSHAVCILGVEGSGTLRFVDLAGSERNYETHHMSARQHRDFADINISLMALKDCFRAHAELIRQRPARPPYRASHLTQVLRSCFTDPLHKTIILATVSPTSTDLLHSINSLAQVTHMSKNLSKLRSECTVELPMLWFTASSPIWQWNSEEVDAWIRTVENGRFKYLVLPPRTTGKMLLQLSSQGLADMFEQSLRAARGQGEGEAWNETATGAIGAAHIGRRLFEAVRREAMRWQGADVYLQDAQRQAEQLFQLRQVGVVHAQPTDNEVDEDAVDAH